ncbi:enoyl-CoA hydratase [Nocardioides scoriae]|uniref:Enoyl-CoA hydratase n=1 Tax=Nocardioides scoriae TaxID=642780 RepID=A0A1H1LGX3_9ACTN|nr:enoyl-CoA hydratase-related protein [Nocardioides scoriae]SDR73139.1 enoyl-CoA hydratase [Nocardioides scoriae]
MTPTSTGVDVRLEGAALWLTLQRPEQYNALTGEMVAALTAELRGAQAREEVRVVVLTGAGRAFCAGADLGGQDAHDNYDGGSVDGANALVRAVLELDTPVVCGLNGVAAGVGVPLALACDLVVATASASLTLAFTGIGLMPDGGASALVVAAVGRARAMRLALLSERVGAEEAHAAGLVSHVAADADHAGVLAELVARLAAGPPLAQAATKRAVNAAALDGLEAAFARERAGQAVLLRTADAAEGMRAFAERRPPVFRGE